VKSVKGFEWWIAGAMRRFGLSREHAIDKLWESRRRGHANSRQKLQLANQRKKRAPAAR
jgi:hypothetical protein